ncbi:hypothetical protein PoB_004904100 [Plakobranchus ocellatus]|uniref:Uncharacterized protein n=1 Tax=Plakobranchus ocellatus TaxID=259542 RepID=A0AAV4BQ08_9GAST|nr:hypothetical protein PoB_004904100 [Plakobranchus ocellatus]
MAARMSQQSPLRKEQLLDMLKENFVVSINTYVSATKAAMRAEKPETAAEIFQSAVAFISQEIPDPTFNALEKQIQEEKVEVRKNCSSLELKLSTSSDSMRIKILHLNRKFDSLKNDLQALDSETRESLKELTEISKENSNALKGLRKFQSLFKEKTQAAAKAVTPPPTAASAAAIARPLKDVR